MHKKIKEKTILFGISIILVLLSECINLDDEKITYSAEFGQAIWINEDTLVCLYRNHMQRSGFLSYSDSVISSNLISLSLSGNLTNLTSTELEPNGSSINYFSFFNMDKLICYQTEKNNPIYIFSLRSNQTSIINKTIYSSPFFLQDGNINVNIGYWHYPYIQGSSNPGRQWISQKNSKIDRTGNILIDSLVDTLPYPMFDTYTKKMIDSIGYYMQAVDWTRDNSKYVFADYTDTIHFYDYSPRVMETSKFKSSVNFWGTCISIGLSPDGSKIAICTKDSILVSDKNGNKKAVRYIK